MMRLVLVWLLVVGATASSLLGADVSLHKILRQLQFSPDGKYVMAQDEMGVSLLTVDPLRVQFQVPADPQVLGRFSPDSGEIVLVNFKKQAVRGGATSSPNSPRVEHWRIADGAQVAVVAVPQLACGTAALAPDGRTLACNDLKGTLHVIDVTNGIETLTKRKFALPMEIEENDSNSSWLRQPKRPHLWAADFEFSPDGRMMIAVPDDEGGAVLWDSPNKVQIESFGELKLLSKRGVAPASDAAARYKLIFRTDSFAFATSDRLAIVREKWLSWKEGLKCSVEMVSFPGGEIASSQELPVCPGGLTFGNGRIQRPFRRAADPNYLIIDYEAEVYETGASQMPNFLGTNLERKARIATLAWNGKGGVVIHSQSPAMDVFGDRYVMEVRPGEVGLSEIGKGVLASIAVSKK